MINAFNKPWPRLVLHLTLHAVFFSDAQLQCNADFIQVNVYILDTIVSLLSIFGSLLPTKMFQTKPQQNCCPSPNNKHQCFVTE